MRSVSDPLTEDPAELDARADEEAREQRWARFGAEIGRDVRVHGLSMILRIVAEVHARCCASMNFTPNEQTIVDFAESEGWHGVLSAIARAMREQAASDGD